VHTKQIVYDSLYESAIHQGWSGWGGDYRLVKGPEQVARILAQPYVPRTGKVLELGCGEGHLCRLLAQHGYDVTGIDISSVAINWANEKNAIHHTTIHYYQGDLSHTDFQVFDHFDLIVDGNCFHCILGDDRPVFLKNVYASLSENGIFFVSSLCSRDADNHIILRAGEPYRHIPTCDNLKDEVYHAGFDVLDLHVHEHSAYDHINLFLKKAESNPVLCEHNHQREQG
jgi:cyclopropane fatty-acyl-phospholipid synthase-like methyltransferase